MIKEPIPYFGQFSTATIPTNINTAITDDEDSKKMETQYDVAARHNYAIGLEGLPSFTGPLDYSHSMHMLQEEEGGSSLSIGLPVPPPPLAELNSEDKIGYEIKK